MTTSSAAADIVQIPIELVPLFALHCSLCIIGRAEWLPSGEGHAHVIPVAGRNVARGRIPHVPLLFFHQTPRDWSDVDEWQQARHEAWRYLAM